MKKNDNKIGRTINDAYNYLLNLDNKTLNHYYSNQEKQAEIIETFSSIYKSTKLGLGMISGGMIGTTVTDLMNKDLDVMHAMACGLLAGAGSLFVLVGFEGILSSVKVNLDYLKNKKKFKDASEIVKMSNKVDDNIASTVMFIDSENIKKAKFRK